MSVRMMSLVWPMDLSPTDKMVLLALADSANDDGYAWPPIKGREGNEHKGLMRKTSLSERAIQKSIQALKVAGHLTRNEVIGKGVSYLLHPRTSCTPAEDAPPHEGRPAPDAPTPAPRAPKPSVTIPSEAKASSGKRASKSEWHRLPDDWVPSPALPPRTAEKVAQWPPGKIDDELAALRRWARNAKDENGKGRKKDWQSAWVNWLERADSDRQQRHPNLGNGISRTLAASASVFGSLDEREPDFAGRFAPAGYLGTG